MYTYNETYSERLYDLKLFDCIVNCFMMSRSTIISFQVDLENVIILFPIIFIYKMYILNH